MSYNFDRAKIAQWATVHTTDETLGHTTDEMSGHAMDETTDQDVNLGYERAVFGEALRNWQITQQQLSPQLGAPPLIDEEQPELVPLRLPSSFTLSQRVQYGLTSAAEVKLRLRREDALNILSDLCDTIHEYNHTVTEKRVDPNSQRIGTRVQGQLAEIKSRMEALRQQYMATFTTLTSLGCLTNKEGLFPLEKSQLWGKKISYHTSQVTQRGRTHGFGLWENQQGCRIPHG